MSDRAGADTVDYLAPRLVLLTIVPSKEGDTDADI